MSAKIPRLSAEKMPVDLAERLRPRVERLGYLGEFFQCMAHQPKALHSFMDLTEALKEALPDNLTEVVALSVAALTGNDYERNQHERLCEKLGFDRAWIAGVSASESARLSPEEAAVQRLVRSAVAGHGRGAAKDLDALADLIGAQQAVGVLFLIGRYLTHAVIVNALALEPPVPGIFGESR